MLLFIGFFTIVTIVDRHNVAPNYLFEMIIILTFLDITLTNIYDSSKIIALQKTLLLVYESIQYHWYWHII